MKEKKEVIALVRRGIGVEAALRVVENMRVDEEVFYRDILVTEMNYMKIKKFWESKNKSWNELELPIKIECELL